MKIQWPDGLSEALFLANYWQQKPLLIRGAFVNFANPLDPNELAGLACDEDANARFIEHTGNNEWRLCAGPLSDDFFDDVTGNQWSLLVSDIEKLLPDFQRYLEPFRFLPDWRIDDLMISYAPVGGSVGAHVDQYDVFLLQADGTREWQIETTPRTTNAASVSETIAILGDFSADEKWQLHAGDMLYLPPQFAHHGIAMDEPCMTWSVGFRAPSIHEMLPEMINYLMQDNHTGDRFKDPHRSTTSTPGHIDKSDIDAIRLMLRNAMQQTDDTLNHWIGRYVTESKEPLDQSQTDYLQAADTTDKETLTMQLANGASLRSNSQKRTAYLVNDDDTTLFADGISYSCCLTLAEAICDRKSVVKEDLEAGLVNNLEADKISINTMDLLLALLQKEILILQTDDC